LTGELKNPWRLNTGFWYSRISEAISAALNENPFASAAPPETRKKSRRFMIGDYITMERVQWYPPLEAGVQPQCYHRPEFAFVFLVAIRSLSACLFPRPE
jgi:hypothetical protein